MDANNDISKLVEFADRLVYEKAGQHLETVEKEILRQTLNGKKLNAIECPSYENSYVQRFRAPKLWHLLSVVTGEKVSKKTVKEVLQRLQMRSHSSVTANHEYLAKARAELNNGHVNLNGSVSCLDSLLFRQQREISTPNSQSQKDEASPNSSKQNFHSSSQPSQPKKSEETKSSSDDLPRLMNFIQPGMALLLSVAIVSSLFVLSWLANWYGVKKQLTGDLPKAQLSYNLGLKLNPWSGATHYNQAVTYEEQQNYESAHAKYQLAIESGIIEAYNNQARLYILQGNYDAAISLLRIGLPLTTNELVKADMYKNRGWARLEQGRYDEAKLDLTEAIKHKSDRASAYCLLAQVLERQGNKKAALFEWENCLKFAYQPKTPEEDKWLYLARQSLDPKQRSR